MDTKKKTIIVIFAAIISLGLIAWLASPMISEYIEKERAAIKALEAQNAQEDNGEMHIAPAGSRADDVEEKKVMISDRMGQFAGQKDHQAKGDVVLDVRDDDSSHVQFGENFEVAGGNGLVIYFGSNSAHDPEAQIGVLLSGSGVQEYPVPQSINPIRYDTIWLVSKGSAVPYAKASLQNKNTHINPNSGVVPE